MNINTPNTESSRHADKDHDENKGNVVITWPLKDDAFISDDEIVEETSLDQYGRPFTTVPGTDPDGKPMRVECHTAPDGSPYTIENRVSDDGRPYSVKYPGEWNGKAWRFDPTKLPKWKQEQIGRDFYNHFTEYMRELEKDPVRKAEFEARVEGFRKRKKE